MTFYSFASACIESWQHPRTEQHKRHDGWHVIATYNTPVRLALPISLPAKTPSGLNPLRSVMDLARTLQLGISSASTA
jgi:hypothetical protein